MKYGGSRFSLGPAWGSRVCRASGPACHRPEFHGDIRHSATEPVALHKKRFLATRQQISPRRSRSTRRGNMEGRDSRSDQHGGDDVLSTKSAECVGQAALLATGQSFTATSDIWQPSRSPYTKRDFSAQGSNLHHEATKMKNGGSRFSLDRGHEIQQEYHKRDFSPQGSKFHHEDHDAHEGGIWRVEILARTGMGETTFSVLSQQSV